MKRISNWFGALSGLCGIFVIGSLAVVSFPNFFLASEEEFKKGDLFVTLSVLAFVSFLCALFFALWVIFDAKEQKALRLKELKQSKGCPTTEAALERADKIRSEESLRRQMTERGAL